MTTYIVTDHDSRWLPGCAAVNADTEGEARQLLDAELQAADLMVSTDFPYTLVELPEHTARIIRIGETTGQ